MQNSERGGDQATDAVWTLAQRSDLTEGQLNELFASSDPRCARRCRWQPIREPGENLCEEGMRTDRFAMRSFARRSDLSQETLDFLGRAGVPWDVLRIVAGNPNTSSVTLERLSRESVAVRQAVASNVRCPPRGARGAFGRSARLGAVGRGRQPIHASRPPSPPSEAIPQCG
jgi:hypothetical protein